MAIAAWNWRGTKGATPGSPSGSVFDVIRGLLPRPSPSTATVGHSAPYLYSVRTALPRPVRNERGEGGERGNLLLTDRPSLQSENPCPALSSLGGRRGRKIWRAKHIRRSRAPSGGLQVRNGARGATRPTYSAGFMGSKSACAARSAGRATGWRARGRRRTRWFQPGENGRARIVHGGGRRQGWVHDPRRMESNVCQVVW